MTNAQAAAFLFPFLFTLMIGSILIYFTVKVLKGTARVATAPVRYIHRNRR